jgi:hypothetical protein
MYVVLELMMGSDLSEVFRVFTLGRSIKTLFSDDMIFLFFSPQKITDKVDQEKNSGEKRTSQKTHFYFFSSINFWYTIINGMMINFLKCDLLWILFWKTAIGKGE